MFERTLPFYQPTHLYFYNPEDFLFDDHEEPEFGFYSPATQTSSPYHHRPSHDGHGLTLRQLQLKRQQEREKQRFEQERLQRIEEERRLRQMQLEEEELQRRRRRELEYLRAQRLQKEQEEERQRAFQEKVQRLKQQEQERQRKLQQEREEELRKQQQQREEQLIQLRKRQEEERLRLQQRRVEAALKIQRTFRSYQARKEAGKITLKLRKLREIQHQLTLLKGERHEQVFSSPVFAQGKATPSKGFLEYEDAVLKLMLKLDGVMSEGSEIVRDSRKKVVANAQEILRALDQLKTSSEVTTQKEAPQEAEPAEIQQPEVEQVDEVAAEAEAKEESFEEINTQEIHPEESREQQQDVIEELEEIREKSEDDIVILAEEASGEDLGERGQGQVKLEDVKALEEEPNESDELFKREFENFEEDGFVQVEPLGDDL